MGTKKDSYLRIRITKQEKAVLKNLVELRNTTMTDFVKSLIDSKVNVTFA